VITINGANAETASGFAHRIGATPQTVASWLKKYIEKGGEITPAHQEGNMKFFLCSDLEAVRAAFQREKKAKAKTYSELEYDHLQALLEEASLTISRLSERAEKAEACAESIISG